MACGFETVCYEGLRVLVRMQDVLVDGSERVHLAWQHGSHVCVNSVDGSQFGGEGLQVVVCVNSVDGLHWRRGSPSRRAYARGAGWHVDTRGFNVVCMWTLV